MNKLMCMAYVMFFVGLASGQVGTIPAPPTEPYYWWWPISVFLVLIAPAITGYLAGREDATEEMK